MAATSQAIIPIGATQYATPMNPQTLRYIEWMQELAEVEADGSGGWQHKAAPTQLGANYSVVPSVAPVPE